MKTKFLILLLSLFFQFVFSQEIVGSWKGDLEIQGMKLPLVIHISKEKMGYSSTLDSPNQKSYGILADKTTFENQTLYFEVKKLNLTYTGTLKDHKIDGKFTQNNFQTNLVLLPFSKDSKSIANAIKFPKNWDNNLKKVDNYLTYLEKNNYNAGSISIFKDRKEIYNRTFGEKNLPNYNANNQLLQIGSITKTFTAKMLNEVFKENHLPLSQKLSLYFPNVPNAEKITMEQMLNHTSGLGDYTKKGEDYYWLQYPTTEMQIMENIISQKPLFEPGTSTSYSNTGYYLLTKILEKITKKSYADLLTNRIIQPLELKETFSAMQQPNHIFSSYQYQGKWELVKDFDFKNVIGVGDIAASPKDLNLFINQLFSENTTIKAMLPKTGQQFGLGIMKVPFYNKIFYGHSGGTYGTNSLMIYDPEEKLSISYSLNASRINSNDFVIGIASVLYGLDYEFPKINESKISVEMLKKYEGEYVSTQIPLGIKIMEKEGQLYGQGTGQPSFPLEWVENNTFKNDEANLKITFFPEKKEMKLNQNSMEFAFTRK